MIIRTGRPAALALLGLALAGLALAGCSADSSRSDSAPAMAPPQDNAKADSGTSGKAPDGTVPAPAAGGQNSPQLAPQLRSIIYTGTLAMTVPDVAKAADAAGGVATAAG